MPLLGMRKTKLVYVENDSALRGLLAELLAKSAQIDLVGVFEDASALLNSGLAANADAALLDYSLDAEGLNGVELGIHLRTLNENIGIVIYSQFSVAPMVRRVPASMLSGWSFFQKEASAGLDSYLTAISAASTGHGNWRDVLATTNEATESEASLFFRLTPRQRSIMALAAKSKSSQEIALQLGVSYTYVRKELSRAYQVLLPEASEADDLRTAAVLRYLELMRASQ